MSSPFPVIANHATTPYRRGVQCPALILCDSASLDPATGKWLLVGPFDRVEPDRFPCTVQFAVYAVVEDWAGELMLAVSREETTVAELVLAQPVPGDAHVTTDVTLRVIQPGAYCVRLMAQGRVLAERRLRVALKPFLHAG